MDGRDDLRRELGFQDGAALFRHAERGAEDCLSGGRPETDEQLRFHKAQLDFQPWTAGGDLA